MSKNWGVFIIEGNVTREGLVNYANNQEHKKDANYKMDNDAFVLQNGEVLLFTDFGRRKYGFLRISPN